MRNSDSNINKDAKKWMVMIALLTGLTEPLYSQEWQVEAFPNDCGSVACSADGVIFYASCGENGQALYKSIDRGTTWTNISSFGSTRMVCCADASKIAFYGESQDFSTNGGAGIVDFDIGVSAAAWSGTGNVLAAAGSGLSLTTNDGATWITPPVLQTNILGLIALSADGKLIVAAPKSGALVLSTNRGETWFQTTATNQDWTALACTADGRKIVAVGFGDPPPLVVSYDQGQSWSNVFPAGLPPGYNNNNYYSYSSLSCSTDGSLLVANIDNYVYLSRNFGASWLLDETPGFLDVVTCSADGTLLLAAAGGYVDIQHLLPPLVIAPTAGQLTLSWPAPSSQYTLQQVSDLSSTNWLAVTNAITVPIIGTTLRSCHRLVGMFFIGSTGPTNCQMFKGLDLTAKDAAPCPVALDWERRVRAVPGK